VNRSARGYLLIEAAIAGGLLVVAIGVALALVVQARTSVSSSANAAAAAALLRSKVDEIASQTVCPASSPLVDVGAGFPGFRWSWSADNAAVMTASAPALTGAAPLCEVDVTVEYPVAVRSRDDASDGTVDNGRGQLRLSKMWRP
jgi:hypothetical protein